MTATEDRLRELLQAAAPHLDGVSPDLPETQPHRARLPLTVAGAVVLVAALALVLTVFTGRASDNTNTTPPGHSSPPRAIATGDVQGTLLIVPPIRHQYPTSGTIIINGPHHLKRHVGAGGGFSVTLPPGRYTIIGHTSKFIVNGREGDCTTQTSPTVVRARLAIHVTVLCSEK